MDKVIGSGAAAKSLWGRDHVSVVEHGTNQYSVPARFVESRNEETFTIKIPLTLKSSLLLIADTVAEILIKRGEKPLIKSDYFGWLLVECTNAIVTIEEDDNRNGMPAYAADGDPVTNEKVKLFTPILATYNVKAVANRDLLLFILEELKSVYKDERFAQIKWWYHHEQNGTTYKTTFLEAPKTKILPEFYPNLKDPKAYLKEYLASDASILMIAGPPGTAKTTLLRHMIYENHLIAGVVYDERLMERDNIFQSFLFSSEDDVLIIEDADVILTSREMGNNKLMSRFLNISDGLIKLPNKKLVFTTNIDDFGRIDQALMRPGRCFDILHTRALNQAEVAAAVKVAGLPTPAEKREYTIAELFNQNRQPTTPRRFGFGT